MQFNPTFSWYFGLKKHIILGQKLSILLDWDSNFKIFSNRDLKSKRFRNTALHCHGAS